MSIKGIIDDIGGIFEGINPFGVFADFFNVMIELAKNIGPLFDFIFFLINNIIDVIYGSLSLLNGIGKEFVEILPHFNKIMDLILDIIDFIIDFYRENSKLLIVSVMLIPAYGMIYLLIRQINAIF